MASRTPRRFVPFQEVSTVFSFESRQTDLFPLLLDVRRSADAIMIGTGDLRLSMRMPFGLDGAEPEYLAALETIKSEAKKSNLPPVGFALGVPAVQAKLQKRYQVLMVAADVLALAAGQSAGQAMARSAVAELNK